MADNGRSRVVLVGAGGLGSAAALVLRRARRALEVVVVDDDRVENGNLHRQILHRSMDAGADKAGSAARALHRRPVGDAGAWELSARARVERVDADNVLSIVGGAGVVLDGSDNFATKFLVNDACVLAGVPFVHAAAVRWGGQLLAVDPRRSDEDAPCYRCLFEAPPPPEAGQSCGEAGVAGPAVGVIGALQAEAALALLDGERVGGALFIYDGREGKTRVVRFRKNPRCVACGSPAATRLDPAAYAVPAC